MEKMMKFILFAFFVVVVIAFVLFLNEITEHIIDIGFGTILVMIVGFSTIFNNALDIVEVIFE